MEHRDYRLRRRKLHIQHGMPEKTKLTFSEIKIFGIFTVVSVIICLAIQALNN